MLFVLTGPLLAHGAIAAMARFAASVLAGGQAETAPLNAIDRRQAKHRAELDAIEARVRTALSRYPDLDALVATQADLAREIASMDWTYDYADRPGQSGYQREARIRAGLKSLPLEDATALFLAKNEIYWTKLRSYLQGHPDLVKLAA